MARQRKASSVSAAWQWSRTAQTQRALLAAAREVFTARGFTESSIADIVQRAASSVGSLYHHFGGKSELFLALWEQHQAAHEEAASKAVAEARSRGVADPGELFEAGARAYMNGSWERRDLALLFASGDVPPGWEVMRRRRNREWIGQNDSLLRLTDRPEDRVYAAILTSLIGEGAYEVAAASSRREADMIIDAVSQYARRLMRGGPWHPGPEPLPARQPGAPAAGEPAAGEREAGEREAGEPEAGDGEPAGPAPGESA
jgi:AcrR family transcriptional regulator